MSKMSSAIFLAAIVTIAFARAKDWDEISPHLFPFGLENDLTDPEFEMTADPKPCCFPETWQGVLSASIAKAPRRGPATHKSSLSKVYIDGPNKRIAVRIECPYLKRDVIGVVGVYNQTTGIGFTLYAFKIENATKCWSHKFDTLAYKKSCIPENATFMGSAKLGLYDSGLAINAFGHSFKSCKLAWEGSFAVTDQCIPILFRESGIIGGGRRGEKCVGGEGSDGDEEADDDERDGDEKGEEDGDEAVQGIDPRIRLGFRLTFQPNSNAPNTKRPHPRPGPGRHGGSTKFVVNVAYLNLQPKISDPSVFNVPDICKKSGVVKEMMGAGNGMDDRFKEELDGIVNILEHGVL